MRAAFAVVGALTLVTGTPTAGRAHGGVCARCAALSASALRTAANTKGASGGGNTSAAADGGDSRSKCALTLRESETVARGANGDEARNDAVDTEGESDEDEEEDKKDDWARAPVRAGGGDRDKASAGGDAGAAEGARARGHGDARRASWAQPRRAEGRGFVWPAAPGRRGHH